MADLRKELAARVEAARDELIATTQRLVAVASPNPPSDTEEISRVTEVLLGGAVEYILVDELVVVARIHTLTAFNFLTAGQ